MLIVPKDAVANRTSILLVPTIIESQMSTARVSG